MTSRRRIVWTVIVAAALSVSVPAFAAANSLLSGYGSPGQGSQAILGSTLLGGGGGSGGSSGSGSSNAGGSSGSGSALVSPRAGQPSGTTGSSTGNVTGVVAHHPRDRGGEAAKSRKTGVSGSSRSRPSTYQAAVQTRANAAGAGAAQTWGLSAADLPYILLVLAGLAFTGILTRHLAREKGSGGNQSLKGRVTGPE